MPADERMMVLLAVDPGTAKCGLAVVTQAGEVLARRVVETRQLPQAARELVDAHGVTGVVVGNRTGARRAIELLRDVVAPRPISQVEEHLSSVEARRRYFGDHPPRGLWRLVPLGLRVPPCPVDDYGAVILAERFLANRA